MSTIEGSDRETRARRIRNASASWSLAAAGLFLASAALQLVASLQRWLLFRAKSDAFVVEDHLYDYSFPHHPWENIETSAQFFGAGMLLLVPGVLAMALGVLAMPRTIPRHRILVVILNTIEMVVALLVAGSFAILGAHALISGATGDPSPLSEYGTLGWVGVIGLIVLIVRWGFRSTAAMMACVFLLGATGVGHIIAAYQVAPIFAGYVSHDTTPWTETVIAVWTATAGVAMIFAAVDARRRALQGATQ